jgi:sugar phosphate isomerase/epimerase
MRRFRIGATSFVYPASWLENVEQLVGRVEDVELLFFEPEGPGGLPDAAELAALATFRRSGLSYSIHTPLSASLASEDEARRVAGVAEVLRVIDATRAVDPSAYVIHVYFGDGEHGPRPRDLDGFRRRSARSIEALLEAGVPARQLCVEYRDYDLDLLAPVIEHFDLGVALDAGHLMRDGRDVPSILQRYLPRTQLIQWHGTEPGGRDHKSLEHLQPSAAREFVRSLLEADYAGVLTLEVFSPDDFERSLSLLRRLLAEAEG